MSTRLVQTATDTDNNGWPRIPIGSWFDQVVDWCDRNLAGVFDAIETPFDWAIAVIIDGDGATPHELPRLAVIAVLGLIAYLGGGWKRAMYVTTAVAVLALLGTTNWVASIGSLYMLMVSLAAIALLVTALYLVAVVVARRSTTQSAHSFTSGLSRTGTAWGWVQPYALVLPGVWYFGIGIRASVILAALYAAPFAAQVALHLTSSTTQTAQLAWRPVASAVRSGTRAAIQPALIALTIFSLIGAGGIWQWLFRGINNQDPVITFEASLAIWLIGFIAWALLGPWSFDHLPGNTGRQSADQRALANA